MHFDRFDTGAKRASCFYSFLTIVVMTGICLLLVPDAAIEALNSSGVLSW
ncbi:hypothetical protein [Microbaculum marinisediminis]|uniref:Uncharacterized protein n=1 Tax=Microbaculum marinisediminis TaxID=2931392 RepID=A0AAW5QVJ3_9HYPH|nr:hypothetical protein [Microbaculum sp. A6E488]MCT8970546.1 hypothetical protein [Microbaculum sp. A6E488]